VCVCMCVRCVCVCAREASVSSIDIRVCLCFYVCRRTYAHIQAIHNTHRETHTLTQTHAHAQTQTHAQAHAQTHTPVKHTPGYTHARADLRILKPRSPHTHIIGKRIQIPKNVKQPILSQRMLCIFLFCFFFSPILREACFDFCFYVFKLQT
jgi:hypothetical protein